MNAESLVEEGLGLIREIMEQNAYIREWGGQFVVPIPELAVYL